MVKTSELAEAAKDLLEEGEDKIVYVRFVLLGEVFTLAVEDVDRGNNSQIVLNLDTSMNWDGGTV